MSTIAGAGNNEVQLVSREDGNIPLLEMVKITKRFPGVQALNEVSLSIQAGEVRALLGENGAEKSTLMNILDGVFSEYGGEILIDGRTVSIHTPRDAQKLGIAMLPHLHHRSCL